MDITEIKDQIEVICDPKHEALEREMERMRNWIKTIDNRMWVALGTAAVSAISALGAIIYTFLTKHI